MTTRDKVFWLLWVIIALAAILFTIKSSADSFPTQGSGAHDLIRKWKPRAESIPEPTTVLLPTYRNFYFAAIATNAIGPSDLSNEAVYTRTSNVTFVTLKWDAPLADNVDGYFLYWGKESGMYTNKTFVGTNLTATARIIPEMPSNLVVTVSSTNSIDLEWSTSIRGPWSRMGSSNFTIMNPSGPRYYRPYGFKTNSHVFIGSSMK